MRITIEMLHLQSWIAEIRTRRESNLDAVSRARTADSRETQFDLLLAAPLSCSCRWEFALDHDFRFRFVVHYGNLFQWKLISVHLFWMRVKSILVMIFRLPTITKLYSLQKIFIPKLVRRKNYLIKLILKEEAIYALLVYVSSVFPGTYSPII